MNIGKVLHDLIEHCPAYQSEHNREEAHQAVDDEFGETAPEPEKPAETPAETAPAAPAS